MKPIDDKLERLLQAAAKAPPRGADEIPLGLETRVLTQWRAGATEDESVFLLAFLRRAMVGASLVLVLSAAWSLSRSNADENADGAAFANYELQGGLN